MPFFKLINDCNHWSKKMSRLSFILEDGDSLEMDPATEEVSVD